MVLIHEDVPLKGVRCAEIFESALSTTSFQNIDTLLFTGTLNGIIVMTFVIGYAKFSNDISHCCNIIRTVDRVQEVSACRGGHDKNTPLCRYSCPVYQLISDSTTRNVVIALALQEKHRRLNHWCASEVVK